MNYVNAPKHSLFAAVTSFAVTVVVTASIVFGMAGIPQDTSANVALSAPVQIGLSA